MFHRATGAFILEIQLQGYVQTDATLLANNSQYCWMVRVASVFTLCCMFLRVVGSCCAKFETGKIFLPRANRRNVVWSACCVHLHVT